jgi:hypothetical protein
VFAGWSLRTRETDRAISHKGRSETPLSRGYEPTRTTSVGKRVGMGRGSAGFAREEAEGLSAIPAIARC